MTTKGVSAIDNHYAVALHKIWGLSLNKYFVPLYEYFGSWEQVWQSDKNPPGVGVPQALWDKYLYEKKSIEPEKLAEAITRQGIKTVTRLDPHFSRLLLQISNIPCILYYIGDVLLLRENVLAVVGSRKASYYGQQQAKLMAKELAAQGLVIASGMARGIDGAAHEGALEANRPTIAVLGSGVDVPYPRENKRLYDKICERGLVISEYFPGTPPAPSNFPIRNRIISGLSMGVYVIEARAKSGSLITSDYALEQGREVFALPGPVNTPNSIGPLRLIQNGAKLVIYPEDILEELGFTFKNRLLNQQIDKIQSLKEQEKRLLESLTWEPAHIDSILGRFANENKIYELLINLEIKGLIKQLPGKYYLRV